MISFLRGKIKDKVQGSIILEVNNIGYQVYLSPILQSRLKIGQEIELYTHQYLKEDSSNLYGFKSLDELELFELLLSISGIGPKSALGVFSVASVDEIKESIAAGEPALLTKVSGIGRKIAERVILELREKIDKLETRGSKAKIKHLGASDEIDALIALGYSLIQAREALAKIDPKIKESGERIREALKKLGK